MTTTENLINVARGHSLTCNNWLTVQQRSNDRRLFRQSFWCSFTKSALWHPRMWLASFLKRRWNNSSQENDRQINRRLHRPSEWCVQPLSWFDLTSQKWNCDFTVAFWRCGLLRYRRWADLRSVRAPRMPSSQARTVAAAAAVATGNNQWENLLSLCGRAVTSSR